MKVTTKLFWQLNGLAEIFVRKSETDWLRSQCFLTAMIGSGRKEFAESEEIIIRDLDVIAWCARFFLVLQRSS
jgi:hypothetical protein